MSQISHKNSEMPCQAEDHRHERKFLVSGLEQALVELALKTNPLCFRESYNPRFVNSLYLDSRYFNSFRENIEGYLDREKVRLRWYGELNSQTNSVVLEFKYKRGLVVFKERFPLKDIFLESRINRRDLLEAIRANDLPKVCRDKVSVTGPVLICRYKRKYFETVGLPFRATVDVGMCYIGFLGQSLNFGSQIVDRQSVILELKYPPTYESLAKEITEAFPFRVTKSSKYVMGLQSLFGCAE